MAKSRAKNLGDADIKRIAEILDGWTGKLTWDLLIEAIELRMHDRYTRQTLYKHERIHHAFELHKERLALDLGEARRVVSPELQVAIDRIARLEAQNKRLESENERLLEQFARWAYNAHTRGLDHDFLERALPSVNRGQTSRVNER